MLGNAVNDLVLESGDLNGGAAMSMLMLLAVRRSSRRRLPAGEDQAARDVSASAARSYDAVIIGGGHNGLVAAFYLARAGLRDARLERRDIVGGCCVTEEFAPGFRASTGAYVLSMLREPVWRDLRLVERGIAVDPAGPSLNLFADGSAPAPRRRPRGDAGRGATLLGRRRRARCPAFEAELAEIAELITPLIDTTPPDPRRAAPARPRPARWARRARGAPPRADRRRALSLRHLGHPVPLASTSPVRPGARGARLARDQRLDRRPVDARERHSSCSTITPPSRPAAASASGVSSAAASAG